MTPEPATDPTAASAHLGETHDGETHDGETHDLRDLVVVEVAGSVAGAHTAKLFGDLGAQVACLEPAGGAPLRADPAVWAAFGTTRVAVPIDSDAAAEWLRRADVVIESCADGPVRPRADIAALLRGDVVRVELSPFGATGPYASWTSADIIEQAMGGHLYLSGDPAREPLQGPADQAAHAAGVFGAVGAMAALHARRRGAGGQVVEVTHHEAMAALHQFTDVRYSYNGAVLKRMGNRYAGPGSPIGMYRAADGWIAFTVATAEHGETLFAVTGLSELIGTPGIETVTDLMITPKVLDPALNGWLADYTVADAVELLQSVRLAVAPVRTMTQLLDDPQLAVRDYWQTVHVGEQPVTIAGPPFRITGWTWRTADAPAAPSSTAALPAPAPATNAVAAPHDLSDGPLTGLRVLDLTRVWAGPLAARILAELGADVVVVEAPWARTPRVMPQAYVDASHFFPDDRGGDDPWNRNGFLNKYLLSKKSLCLDIASPAGREAFERLVPQVDVVMENYSPRVMPNLGLGEERLHELNPSLVYLTMPGYGRTGPCRDYSAYGPVLDSHAGLSTLMGYPELDAWKCGIAWPDPVAGIHAAFATLVALWGRECDPQRRGTTVEIAQFETAISMVSDRLVRAQLDGADPALPGNRHPTRAPQSVYPCIGDDRWLALSVPDDERWAALCDIAALPAAWRSWTTAERRQHHDDIDDALRAWSATTTREGATAQLQARGVPAAPVCDAADFMRDPQLSARGFYAEVTQPGVGTYEWVTMPLDLSATPTAIHRPSPSLGQHNAEILGEWAELADDELRALEAAGVIASMPPA